LSIHLFSHEAGEVFVEELCDSRSIELTQMVVESVLSKYVFMANEIGNELDVDKMPIQPILDQLWAVVIVQDAAAFEVQLTKRHIDVDIIEKLRKLVTQELKE